MTHTNKRIAVCVLYQEAKWLWSAAWRCPSEEGREGGGCDPTSQQCFPPLPHSQEVPRWGEPEDRAAAPPAKPEKWARAKGAGKQGHSPLLVFVSQEKVLHLLPSEVQLVVIVAFNCLRLIHRVIQRQEELFEGLHYGRWHPQVNLCDAAQPGGGIQSQRLAREQDGEPR